MLAAKTDEGTAVGLPASPSRRKSMLTKTFRAIGKVKPFKKKKCPQMELMNSCASFDFEAESSDADDDDCFENEDDDIEKVQEEEETEPEAVTGKNAQVDELYSRDDKAEDDEVIHDMIRTITPTESEDVPSSAESTPQSRQHCEVSSENEVSTLRTSRRAGNKRSAKASHSRSPVPRQHSNSKSRKSGHLTRAPDPKVVLDARSSPKLVDSPVVESTSVCHNEDQSLRIVDDVNEHSDEPLRRCSKAFADDIAMGGYFARIQDKKNKDTGKSQSWKASADHSTSTLKQTSAHNLSSPIEDKRRRTFIPSRNIKKLFGLKKADIEDNENIPKSPKSPKRRSEPSSKDEAAKLMLELSTMLSANKKIDRDERPMRSHTSRPSRTFVFDEADDDGSTQNFPEIPAAKKTSLSEIRRMMETSKEDTMTQQISKQEAPKISSTNIRPHKKSHTTRNARSFVFDETVDDDPKHETHNNSAETYPKGRNGRRTPSNTKSDPPGTAPISSKHQTSRTSMPEMNRPLKSSQVRSQRTSLIENLEEDTRAPERSFRTKKSMKNNQSPTSVTEVQINDEAIDLGESNASLQSVPDEKLLSPSGRRHRKGYVKRPSSDSSQVGHGRPSPTHERASLDVEDSEGKLHLKTMSSQGVERHHRSIRSSASPVHYATHEKEDEVEVSMATEPESPRSLRRKRLNHRTGGRRSTNTSSQSEYDDSLSNQQGRGRNATDELSLLVDQKETEVVVKNGISNNFPRQLHKVDSKVRPLSDIKHRRKDVGSEDGRNNEIRLSNMSHVGRPPLNKSSSSRRRLQHPEQTSLESQRQHQDAEKAANPTTVSKEVSGHAALKNPSLAKSLQEGKLAMLMAHDDGQYSVSTDDGSEMFVKGKILYSRIRSDASVGAPQLVIGPSDENTRDLQVKNV